VADGAAEPTLRKGSALLKQSFVTLVQLSTQLIDANWDKTILESCMLSCKPT